MGSEPEADALTTGTAAASGSSEAPRARQPRRRLASILFLLFGAFVALYLSTLGPREQHVRIVVGSAAVDVTAIDLRYVGKDGEVVRSTQFRYPKGGAPRVIAHEPQLPNGDYRLEIDVDLEDTTMISDAGQPGNTGDHPSARDGRRSIQRQVTLGGGSTQVDVSTALARTKTD